MRLALCRWEQFATTSAPSGVGYRPKVTNIRNIGDWSVLDFRGPNGDDSGFCLLLSNTATQAIPGALVDLGDDFKLTLSPLVKAAIQNRLGVNLAESTLGRVAMEMLTSHARSDGTRCNPLVKEVRYRGDRMGRARVWLGGNKLWDEFGDLPDEEVMVIARETFPSNNTDMTSQDNAWDDGGFEVSGGKARGQTTGYNFARCNVATGSANMYAQAVVNFPSSFTGQCGICCRMNDAALTSTYVFHWSNFGFDVLYYDSGGSYQWIASPWPPPDNATAGVDYLLYHEWNGSTGTVKINGTTYYNSTNSAITTGQRGGLFSDGLTSVGDFHYDLYQQGQSGEFGAPVWVRVGGSMVRADAAKVRVSGNWVDVSGAVKVRQSGNWTTLS